MSGPCDTCPYRRSTPLGIWSKAEYENLQRQDADEMGGACFGCHKDPSGKTSCRGWLADQKRRGVPSIQLRLSLLTNVDTIAAFEAVDDTDPDLYDSISEMVEANRDKQFPRRSAKAARLALRLR